MKIFAISDLHLPGHDDKPMNKFGHNWDDHFNKIKMSWNEMVADDDLVLISGDISWAMHTEDAADDLNDICSLSGTKIIIKGNHDYWWNSITKVRSMLSNNTYAIQNDAVNLDKVSIVGSRGWLCPGSPEFKQSDTKIYEREASRLEMSIKYADKSKPLICMIHYPPFNERREDSLFTQVLEKYGIKYVLYGHLHGKACQNAFEGERNGVTYRLCSADFVKFSPTFIDEL